MKGIGGRENNSVLSSGQRKRKHKGRHVPSFSSVPPQGSPIYGLYPVLAVLQNPKRPLGTLWLTEEVFRLHQKEIFSALKRGQKKSLPMITKTRSELTQALESSRPEAVHQGIIWWGAPLNFLSLEDFLLKFSSENACFVLLDDPQDVRNVGAILRSVAAFGATAVLLPKRKNFFSQDILAKVSVGALEKVPLVMLSNVAQSLSLLKEKGFWCYGLDGTLEAEEIGTLHFPPRTVFVAGAEGAGLRQLTRKSCDVLCRIPTQAQMVSLNVSSATAIALYAHSCQQHPKETP